MNRANWANLRDRLRELVDEQTYRALEATTLTAFFTSDEITRAMWDVLKTAGYDGGPVLGPGSGTGNFVGHAPDPA